MVSKEISVLQKGYAKLDATLKERRNILSTRLQNGERLSEKDSDRLDIPFILPSHPSWPTTLALVLILCPMRKTN
ncbi:hypothetical protein BJ165DRAFT_1478675 [Panaeolus papilionaceus]|nr:hypothetical protein BJ165DRAFT_1478675 [Panaeolus papilionaceus]